MQVLPVDVLEIYQNCLKFQLDHNPLGQQTKSSIPHFPNQLILLNPQSTLLTCQKTAKAALSICQHCEVIVFSLFFQQYLDQIIFSQQDKYFHSSSKTLPIPPYICVPFGPFITPMLIISNIRPKIALHSLTFDYKFGMLRKCWKI